MINKIIKYHWSDSTQYYKIYKLPTNNIIESSVLSKTFVTNRKINWKAYGIQLTKQVFRL